MRDKRIDSYIKHFSKEEGKILEELRSIIHTVASFDETISYAMPSFKYKDKIVACIRMYERHVGFYPYSSNILKQFAKELKGYKTSIGAVQLPKDQKLPKTLISKIIKARMKEINDKIKFELLKQ